MANKPVCFQVDKLDKHEIRAIKSVYRGEGTPDQQRLALAVIIKKFSRPHDLLFVPGESDQTVFLNGRAFPGMQILRVLNIPVGVLNDDNEEPTNE